MTSLNTSYSLENNFTKDKFLNNKNKKILNSIFENPVRADIAWTDIEKLVKSLGGKVIQARGSRTAFEINGFINVFHRPHPKPDTNKLTVRDIRDFLERAGVTPDQE